MVTDNNSKIDIIKLYPIPTQDSEEPNLAIVSSDSIDDNIDDMMIISMVPRYLVWV